MTKREVFATSLAVLGATFDRKVSPPLIEGYWLVLEHLEESEIALAMKKALATCKFMPAPAELLALARPPRSPDVDVVQAWQVVRKAIDKYDYLVASIDFGPLVNAVIRNLGGWDAFCRATLPELDNPGWLRKRFETVYKSLVTADAQTLHGEPLEGALPLKWDKPTHVVVPLDGKPPVLRIEANGVSDARASIAAHVTDLAEKLSDD